MYPGLEVVYLKAHWKLDIAMHFVRKPNDLIIYMQINLIKELTFTIDRALIPMSRTRKFDRHASRGRFVRVSLLEFG